MASPRSLWPARVRTPVRRLAVAVVVAPLPVALVLTLGAFVIAGMSERTLEAVIEVTLVAGAAMLILSVGFAVTFGLAGVAFLWLLGKPGAMAWAVTGIFAGAAAGGLFALVGIETVPRPVVLGFMIAGCAIFLLIRRIAGIHVDRPRR